MFIDDATRTAKATAVLALLGCCASIALAQSGTAICDELLARTDVSLDEAVDAGCQLSAAQISELMDNPVGELISAPIQIDRLTVEEPFTGRELTIETTKLIPTFPTKLGENWTLVNRVVIPFVDVPVSSTVSEIGLRPDAPLIDGEPAGTAPFSGSTSGFGDLTYVGLVTPRETVPIRNGEVIWAFGPTFVLPTAEEDLLGQGKYQLGPAFALGYLGERWTIGALAQHWWSVAGDDDRSSVNQTNIQYFISYKLRNQWSIGASPNISVDWSGDGSPTVNLPVGIGINKTTFIGELPVRIGLEATRYIVHDSSIKPEWGARLSFTVVVPSAFLGRD